MQGAVVYSGDPSLVVDSRAAGHVVVGLAAGTGAFNAPLPPPPILPPNTHMPSMPMPMPNANHHAYGGQNVVPAHAAHPVGREQCPHCGAGPDGYTTWQWRYGSVSDQLLCSACGQYEGRTGHKRPLKNATKRRGGRAAP
ncbi:GATA-type domain-containing protein [Mycena chlorophos]|uniref:GATA-type domain-containing protein n=1 Tax=Mycena chlorophos TaxID=658473 RepID=A0A8H6TJ04_MYCCL|nr:GATA-type domain-containing protein [Mycena chlorophos]